MEAQELVYA